MCLWYVVAQACSGDREAQSMDITPEARERLDGFMDARRLELGIPWREVATRAGISYEALRALRNGPGGTADLTARKIDAALEWAPGSIARIAVGGEPRELAPQAQQVPAPAIPFTDAELDAWEHHVGVPLGDLDPSMRRNWLAFTLAAHRRTLADVAAERERQLRKGA